MWPDRATVACMTIFGGRCLPDHAGIDLGDLIRIGNYLLTFQDGQVTPYQSSGLRLDVNDLTVEIEDRRGKFKIIDSFDFSVLPREFIGIVGGSGEAIGGSSRQRQHHAY